MHAAWNIQSMIYALLNSRKESQNILFSQYLCKDQAGSTIEYTIQEQKLSQGCLTIDISARKLSLDIYKEGTLDVRKKGFLIKRVSLVTGLTGTKQLM
jgi:hypothetical protein